MVVAVSGGVVVSDKELIKRIEKVLKNRNSFQKLSKLSDGAFSRQGKVLAHELERALEGVSGLGKAILVNQYQTKQRDRMSRQAFCKVHHISIEQYTEEREQALLAFASVYRGGELLAYDRA